MNKPVTFGGIPDPFASAEAAAVWLLSIPYDGTSTWGKGADRGWQAFLESAENMELYDRETDSEVYRQGIHLLPPLTENRDPETVYRAVLAKTKELLTHDKLLTFFGGEHAISIGVIEAFGDHYPQLNVLQLDAHADLRPSYLGSPYNHACALHAASQRHRLIQVGLRSMDRSETPYLREGHYFLAEEMYGQQDWMEESLRLIDGPVYLTIDLDVLDPGIMPATGTPEPGGLDWNTLLRYLRKLFQQYQVVGFDLVELAPIKGLPAPNFLAAKLYYKLLSYYFHG